MAEKLDVKLSCPALPGDLVMVEAEIEEALSAPTRAKISFLAREDVDGEAAIGADATIEILVDGAAVRWFHLVVVGFQFDGLHDGAERRYTVELAHELHLLALRSDVRMFQEQDAMAIVSAVLDAAGVPGGHYELSLRRSPTKRAYCIQYRETDLDFVARLLEHEGIFWVVSESESAAKVVFADSSSAFEPIDGSHVLPLLDDDGGHGDGVTGFTLETTASPARVVLSDYNLMTPSADLKAEKEASGAFTGDWFEYPAGHQTPAEGQALAAIRMEELVSAGEVGEGRSNVTAMAAGRTFELEQAAQDGLNQEYVILRVRHRVVVRASAGAAEGGGYENHFTCQARSFAVRPARRARRALIRGLHSAVTTGPSGSEIHTDKIGRMKARFFWDRSGKTDDTSSCWMRVAQFPIDGSMALARVGWEMAVAYVDGDPDRPVAVARLYDAEHTSPYAYPAAKTRMTLQTSSSPGGGKSNEIRMEDGGGGQELFVNASKDYLAETGNDKTETIGVDEKRNIGAKSEWNVIANQTVSIGGNESLSVSGASTTTVGASRTKSVGGSETVTVSSDIGVNVAGSDTEITGGSHTTLAALGVSKTSVGSHSLTVGGSMIDAAALGVGFVVAGARSETVGGAKIAASGGPVAESVFGAYASTVGGVCVNAAGGGRSATTKGVSALTVGGVVLANAAGQVTVKAKKISIKVLGVANFLGGGGILNMTPGSASFVGIVGIQASGTLKISGNPNLVG